MGVKWEGWREDGREKLSRKKLRLNRIMQSHICGITQLVTSCNNDVIFIIGTSTLQSHPRLLLPPPQCVKSQAQGPSPIFSATGHTFRRIVVDHTTGLDNVTYEVMFINM